MRINELQQYINLPVNTETKVPIFTVLAIAAIQFWKDWVAMGSTQFDSLLAV
jgi:hypothetical protein